MSTTLASSGYMMPLIGATQLLVGVLLLANRPLFVFHPPDDCMNGVFSREPWFVWRLLKAVEKH